MVHYVRCFCEQHCVYNNPPYDLEIVASSDDLNLKSIHVQQVNIKYDDSNHFVTAVTDMAESFTPVMTTVRTSDVKTAEVSYSEKPATRAHISLPKLITRCRSVTLELTCHLFFDDNTSNKIIISKALPIRKKKMQILSYRAAMNL